MKSLSRFTQFGILVIYLFTASIPLVRAQQADSSLLNLNWIYGTEDFKLEKFGPARWLEHKDGYTTLEPSTETENGYDIVYYQSNSGKREVLISARNLIPDGASDPLEIEDYNWSNDTQKLLIFTNSKRVWRDNTRGDYWVLSLKDFSLNQIGVSFAPSTLMFAKFSPDGDRVAYVQKNNIYIEDLNTHNIKQLTHDGSKTLINGTFDWVYEEELDLQDGFRWSPDGGHIAYWQLDSEGVGTFYMINNTDSLYAKVIPVQYPKVGTTNSACRVGVISADGGQTRWMDVPGDPRNNYIARMEWAASSDEIVIQHLNRLQNRIDIILGDIKTGKTRTILVERDSAWLDIGDDLKWFKNGKQFSWLSERNGWRHLYMVSRDGRKINDLTPFDYDVISVVKIDSQEGWIYFMASPDNAAQKYLYRTRLDGKGKPQRLTPQSQPGTHEYQISPDCQWAIHNYSSFANPTITEVISLPLHKHIRFLAENKKLKSLLARIKKGSNEFFKLNIGENLWLDGWMMKPYNFDPAIVYPVLFYVYSEPADQTVIDEWDSYYLWHLMLTQMGYIVISVDSRGTPGPKGRAWRKSIYGQIGILASADQAEAVRQINRWPFVDSTRIGIWGWSGGGTMTLNALFRYPDLYKMGMCIAPVTDQHYYDNIYQERYMGLPSENVEGYKYGSPITFADQLRGKLLLVHGTGDDNVHYQSTEALIKKLIEYDKYFSLMIYPNQTHSILDSRKHLFGLLTNYLKENL